VPTAGQGELPTPIDTLPDDLPEDVILHEQLGAGAFGTVFRGEWGGHTVAVKVLQTAYSSNSRELDSFRQEIAVLSGLRHPNIIAFLAACTISPDVCIIEELAGGGSLHTKLHGPSGSDDRCRPLAIGDAIQVAIDVAQAMAYLHPSIVHRDLKSQNVLLDSDGRAKVCDFGIAKFKDRTFVSTMNGQAGTPAYMAPELFDGVNATEKVDVYSYAILLWECITGKVPWGHVPSPMQIIYYVGVLNQRPTLPKSVPEALKNLIQDCWTVNPKDRPTFEQILNRLLEMKSLYPAQEGVQPMQVSLESEESSLSISYSSDDGQVVNDGMLVKKETNTTSISLTACALNVQGQTKSYPLTLDSPHELD
jgi:serine/threonine protein kinase